MNQAEHKAKTIDGIKWSLFDKVVSQGAGFVINVILARILLPEDFGLLGMVIVVTGFATVFKDFGLGSAIIQKKNLNEEDLSSVFWFNLLMGLVLFLVIYFSSPLIGSYYERPALQPIAELLSVTYLISAFTTVQLSLLRKQMDFRRIFFVNATASLLSGALAVALALTGWGVWSLVWKLIAFTVIANLVLWGSSRWRPGMILSLKSLKGIMGFSLPLLGTQSLNYWVRNADNLLIGKYLGDAALGFYNQSYRIMLIPVRQISGIISTVMFPSLAQIQDDTQRIKAIYLKVTRLLSFITFPLMFGLCALADPFVEVVLGDKWLPMVPVLRYLCIVGAFQSVGTLNGNIFQATGRTGYQFFVGLPPRILYVVAIVLGLPHGVDAVAFNYMIAVLTSSLYMYYFTGRLVGIKVYEVLASIGVNLLSGVMAGITAFYLYAYLESNNTFLGLILAVCVGAVVYMTLQLLINKEQVLGYLGSIKSLRNAR